MTRVLSRWARRERKAEVRAEGEEEAEEEAGSEEEMEEMGGEGMSSSSNQRSSCQRAHMSKHIYNNWFEKR